MGDFKFLRENSENLDLSEMGFQVPVIPLYNARRYENVEFCFQFDNDEPVVFANGTNDLHIHISPTENGNITFNNGEKIFKIFAREII